ncbi:MAG: hypothetical protein ACRC9R_06515, partial [Enterovibrio sp.]
MELVSLIAFFTFMLIVKVYVKETVSNSILLSSFFVPITYFGHGAIGFILFALFFSIAFLIRALPVKVRLDKLLLFVALFLAFYIVLFLSIKNGANAYLSVLKFFQLIFLALALFISYKAVAYSFSERTKIEKLIKTFIFINITFGILLHVLFNSYDFGLIRFSGIFFDSNYFGIY